MLKLIGYLIALPFALMLVATVLGLTFWIIASAFEVSAVLGFLSIPALITLFAWIGNRLGIKTAEEREHETYVEEVLRDEWNPYRACADGIKAHPLYKTCDTCFFKFFCNRVDRNKVPFGKKPPKPDWACELGINYIPWRHCEWCEYYFVCNATKHGEPSHFEKGVHIPPPTDKRSRRGGSSKSFTSTSESAQNFNNNFYDFDNDFENDRDNDSGYFNSWANNSDNDSENDSSDGDGGGD